MDDIRAAAERIILDAQEIQHISFNDALVVARAALEQTAEIERLHQALCDIQFDLINCPEAAGSKSCEHLKNAIGIVTRTLR